MGSDLFSILFGLLGKNSSDPIIAMANAFFTDLLPMWLDFLFFCLVYYTVKKKGCNIYLILT
ncbi:MAG: hypothetical protein DRP74_09420 [Candidatus Omnitrophota bacterium]|nr:MAG: hypothetical protein DRP74_09420 [Candidatus Omnitrophota bacterium]